MNTGSKLDYLRAYFHVYLKQLSTYSHNFENFYLDANLIEFYTIW